MIARLSGNPGSLTVSLVFHVRRALPFACTQATPHHASHHTVGVSTTCHNALCLSAVGSNGMAPSGLTETVQRTVQSRTVAAFIVKFMRRCIEANCRIIVELNMLNVRKVEVVTT